MDWSFGCEKYTFIVEQGVDDEEKEGHRSLQQLAKKNLGEKTSLDGKTATGN